MAKKPIDFQLLRRYADDAKTYDAERDRQFRMLLKFAYSIDDLLSGDQLNPTPSVGKYNIIKAQINQIVNPILESPPEITVYPGDGANKTSATALGGLLRHIQYECSAPQTYTHATRTTVAGGLGAWKVVIDEDDDGKPIPMIESIEDPTTVHFDPASKRRDRRDARFACHEFTLSVDDFEEEYPEAQVPTADNPMGGTETSDLVKLVEVWVKVKRDGETAMNRYVITENEIVLTDESYPGDVLPVFQMVAPFVEIDGKFVLMPLTFDLIDSQREISYWKTQMAKLIGRAPKSQWMADTGSIAVEDQAAYANSAIDEEAESILFYDSKNGTKQKPQPIEPPELPASYIQLVQSNLAFARDITGIYPDQGQQTAQGADQASGVAIKQQRSVASISSAHFRDELYFNLRRTGNCVIDLAKKVMNDDSIRVSMQGDNTTQLVSFGPTKIKAPGVSNVDLDTGKYGVVVSTGSSYATQKQEMLETLGAMASKNEKVFELVADYLVGQWALPGTEDLQERLQVGLLPATVQQMLASKQGSDPVQRAQQLQLQLQQKEALEKQLTMHLQAVSQELQKISEEYKNLKGDKETEANLKLHIEQMKTDIERLRIESTERIAMHTGAIQTRIGDDKNATTLEVAAMKSQTEIGKTAMVHNHEHIMEAERAEKLEEEAEEVLPGPFADHHNQDEK